MNLCKNASNSGRVNTPVVVPMARTQLAPTALPILQTSFLIQPAQQAVDVAGGEGVAAAGAVHEWHAIALRPQTHAFAH